MAGRRVPGSAAAQHTQLLFKHWQTTSQPTSAPRCPATEHTYLGKERPGRLIFQRQTHSSDTIHSKCVVITNRKCWEEPHTDTRVTWSNVEPSPLRSFAAGRQLASLNSITYNSSEFIHSSDCYILKATWWHSGQVLLPRGNLVVGLIPWFSTGSPCICHTLNNIINSIRYLYQCRG